MHTPQAFAVASFANRPVDKLLRSSAPPFLRHQSVGWGFFLGGNGNSISTAKIPRRPADSCSSSPAPQREFERKAVPARSSCERVSITKLTEIATYCVWWMGVVMVFYMRGLEFSEGGPAIKLHRKMNSTWASNNCVKLILKPSQDVATSMINK